MIVYREARRLINPARELARLRDLAAESMAAESMNVEIARELLIEFGRIESGVADALCPDFDEMEPLAGWRKVSVAIGRNFYRARRGLPILDMREAIEALLEAAWPAEIGVSTPEGYAYYSLFPESYVDTADKFYREDPRAQIFVVGIRSIGASLSAAVAGTILELGGCVKTLTLRPRGHPSHREVRISESIRSEWHANREAVYLLIDEGPGLSGTSLTSVAEVLSDAGIDDSRIIFFPSWSPDSATLSSERARARWVRHRKCPSEFDPDMFRGWRDLSAGKWRELFFAGADFPAVHPAHERRKFLRGHTLAKFVGFGERGRACFDRAKMLHEAGFTSRPVEVTGGFLISDFAEGKPVAEISSEFIRGMAGYLAFLRREAPSRQSVDWEELFHMICINVEEASGRDWSARLLAMRAAIEDQPACELDGRMFRHEWIETPSGFFKSDALDHHDDHFFPGPLDIAWDVAAAMAEFGLNRGFFIERYACDSGDREIARRVPFYRIAYAAHRLAYSRLAATNLTGEEQARFRREVARYSAELKSALVAVTGSLGPEVDSSSLVGRI
ncbi:MAG: hypothetical protein ACRD30_09820 [Bryobacteraceae bacterium]